MADKSCRLAVLVNAYLRICEVNPRPADIVRVVKVNNRRIQSRSCALEYRASPHIVAFEIDVDRQIVAILEPSCLVRIARFHNIFGPYGTWKGGKEKAPAAMCRKVAETPNGGTIEVWGDGEQTRSFLYIDECIEGIVRLTRSDFEGPVNIGSEEMITINDLAKLAIDISGKNIIIKNIDGPTGVRGRNSDNKLIQDKLGWQLRL